MDANNHAGIGSNHLNLHVELQTCLLSQKSVSDNRFLHVRNILDETKEKGCYALNAMLVNKEYMRNVQGKPEHAAFQTVNLMLTFSAFLYKSEHAVELAF